MQKPGNLEKESAAARKAREVAAREAPTRKVAAKAPREVAAGEPRQVAARPRAVIAVKAATDASITKTAVVDITATLVKDALAIGAGAVDGVMNVKVTRIAAINIFAILILANAFGFTRSWIEFSRSFSNQSFARAPLCPETNVFVSPELSAAATNTTHEEEACVQNEDE